MGNQSSGNRLDTVVKLVLIFFISLLSFAVGTFVGKGVSDSEHRIAMLERGDYKGHAEEETVATTEESLSEEEVKSLTEEFIKAEAAAKKEVGKVADRQPAEDTKADKKPDVDGFKHMGDKKSKKENVDKSVAKEEKPATTTVTKAEPKKTPEKTTHKAKEGTVAKAANRVAEGKAPMKDAKKARKPMSTLPSVASTAVGKYTVQVASYAVENEAREHAATLKGKGFSAFYVPAKVKGRTWYRVSVGLFTNRRSAQTFRKELMKQANVSSAIIQKIVR